MSAEAQVRFLSPSGVAKPTGYSHAAEVRGGRIVFTAGQVALDASGAVVGKGDLRAQLVQVFQNLEAALAAAGAGWRNVIKLNYYVVDAVPAADFAIIREVRAKYLDQTNPPASTLVGVSRLVLPDLWIEVEAVAAC